MKCAALALTLVAAIIWSQAQAEPKHDHGTGRLEIAFAETEFTLSLVVPGTDILGFGGPAETDDDRALVAVAISDLSKPLELFVLPDAAECFTTSANVTLAGEHLGQDSSIASGDDQVNHSEFQADYLIQCQGTDMIENIQFAYFSRFPKAEKLVVRVDRSGESRSHDITRAAPNLAF